MRSPPTSSDRTETGWSAAGKDIPEWCLVPAGPARRLIAPIGSNDAETGERDFCHHQRPFLWLNTVGDPCRVRLQGKVADGHRSVRRHRGSDRGHGLALWTLRTNRLATDLDRACAQQLSEPRRLPALFCTL